MPRKRVFDEVAWEGDVYADHGKCFSHLRILIPAYKSPVVQELVDDAWKDVGGVLGAHKALAAYYHAFLEGRAKWKKS